MFLAALHLFLAFVLGQACGKGAMKCETAFTGPHGGEWKVLNTRCSIKWIALNSQAKDECRKRLEKYTVKAPMKAPMKAVMKAMKAPMKAPTKAVMKKAKAASKVAEKKPVPAKK